MSLVPNDTESVVYEYIGDVTSLQKATEQAIGFLDSYQKHIDRISTDGGFGKNVKAAKSFQTAVKSVTKDVSAMQSKLKSVTDVKLFSGTDVQKQITESLSGLAQVQARLQSVTGLTTKEVQALTAQLKSSRQSLQASGAGVDTLVAKEVKFQQTLENTRNRVSQFRDSLDSIRTRVSSVFDPLISRLNSLRNPFARIVQTVQVFKDKAADSFGRISQMASTVSSAFRRVSNSENDASDAATRATKVHSGLASVLEHMRSLFGRETKAVETEEDSLDRKNKTLNSSTRNHRSLGSVVLNLLGIFNRESRSIINMNTQLGNMARSSNLARNALRGLTGVQLGRWLAESVKQSISYVENLNLFQVATGEAYEESLKFVNSMSELYGMDPSNLMRYAGNFYQLADAISMPDKASAALSLGLTKATNDIASLFNVDIETVFENLSSGMQGMSRAVRKYGMDIRTTTLQQTALSLGLTEQVENMSEANRQGLRFITMMQQANNASGDFARTIESPANQLRIFKEQVTQLGRAIGNFLIGPLTTAIAYINGFIMALRMVLQFVGSVIGVVNSFFGGSTSDSAEKTLDNVASGVGSVGSAAKESTKELKKMLAPFDELNLLQEPETDTGGVGGGGGGGGLGDLGTLDPAILKAIEEMQWKLDEVEMKAVKVRNAILAFLGFKVEDGTILSWDAGILEQNLINKFPQWSKTIQAVFDNWSSIVEGFKKLFKSLGEVVTAVWDKILSFIEIFINDDSVSSFIEGLADSLNQLADFVSANADTIADFLIAFGVALTGIKAATGIANVIAPIIQFISAAGPALGSLATVVGIVLAVVAALALLSSQSTELADSMSNAMSNVYQGFITIGESLASAFGQIWASMQTTWTEHMQPMLVALGDALAPVINTVSSLWSNLVTILDTAFQGIAQMYTESIAPAIDSFLDGVSSLCGLFESLWTEFVGPVIEYIGDGLASLWSSTLQPIVSDVMSIIGSLIELVMALWNNILAPLLDWIIQALGPGLTNIFRDIWDIVSTVISNIGSILRGLLQIIRGVLEFLVGVFTGDWERAWNGIVQIFAGLWNTIASILVTVVNVIISVINGAISLIWNAIISVINLFLEAANTVGGWLGYSLELGITASAPQIPTIPAPSVAMATGGVVTSPTNALIGEGRYDEAVVPLGNSPQMKQFADSVADRVNSGEQIRLLRDQNELLKQILDKTGVYLDGREITRVVNMNQKVDARAYGR